MNRKLKVTEMGRISKAEFAAADKTPIIMVLDNIRSLHNVGAVFRTGDAFRIEHVHLCGYTPTPPHREIRKTALGAEDAVAWTHHTEIMPLLKQLQTKGVEVLAIEQTETTIPLDTFQPDSSKRYAIVVGNEVEGVQQAVVDLADHVIEIPQIGTKHSLNVSVCSGIVMWELYSKLSR